MPEPNQQVNPPSTQYYLLEKIAQGGMAEIYKGIALDLHGLRRTVVIKKILPHIASDPEFVDMLISEAKIACMLSHGNIAQIYDLGRVGNDYFMVMEYVDGRSLSQIHKRCLKAGGLIPLPYVAYFISEVANGLDYMHRKADDAGIPLNIIHRDVSPQNVIVSFSGTVKIIDFGIAKAAIKIDLTESGVLKGKFAYMSPEQASGEKVDHRSDVFSLGIIQYELITGRRLFKGKDNYDTLKRVKEAAVDPPSQFVSAIPPELDAIVLKALAKERAARYQWASELSGDLTKFLYQRFPDFKPSIVADFMRDLFKMELEERETLEEEAKTPFLIIDQTQSAIKVDRVEEPLIKPPLPWWERVWGEGERIKTEIKIKEVVDRVSAWWKKAKPKLAWALGGVLFAAIAVAVVMASVKLFRPELAPPPAQAPTAPAPVPLTLRIDSEPKGARVFIDDQETTYTTPASVANILMDGRPHTIGLFLENYKFWKEEFVADKKGIHLKADLVVDYGSLEVTSTPEGATVMLDGSVVGATPLTMKDLMPGSILTLRIEMDGRTPWEDKIRIAPGKAVRVHKALKRQK